jgi:hypothetical protein
MVFLIDFYLRAARTQIGIGDNVNLTKREKYIAIIMGLVVVAWLLDSFVISPYFDELSSLETARQSAQSALDDGNQLLTDQRIKTPLWQAMLKGGLVLDESHAQSQARQALDEWSRSAGITLDSTTPERTSEEGPFQMINFNIDFSVQGRGSMYSLAHLLWLLETAPIPMRVNSVKITSTKEGSDALTVKQLSVSALYMPPTENSKGAAGAVAGQEKRS